MHNVLCSSSLVLLVAQCLFFLALTSASTATVIGSLVSSRSALAGAAAGSKVVFAGGNGSVVSSDVDIYDIAGAKTNSSLSIARSDLAGAGDNNIIIFAGGYDSSGQSVDAIDIFDTTTNAWSVSKLSIPRALLCGAASGGFIVFAGGGQTSGLSRRGEHDDDLGSHRLTKNIGAVDAVDIFDTTTKQWSISRLSVARFGMACAGTSGRIVFAGGTDGTRAFARADVYDTTTNTWSTSSSALSLARSILAAGAAGNRIVFAGGQDSSGIASGVVDIYDVQQDTWTRSPYSLCVPRYFLTGVGAYGGKVFFAGGTSGIGEGGAILWDVFDYYDVPLNQWSNTYLSASPLLQQPRFRLASAALSSYVLFAGGTSVEAVSTTTTELIFSCSGQPPAFMAECVSGTWIVPYGSNIRPPTAQLTFTRANATTINATTGQGVTVNGSLDLPPTASITIVSSSNTPSGSTVITVIGTATVDGTLAIILTDIPKSDTLIPVLNATSINGSFDNIDVQAPSRCIRLTGSQSIDSTGSILGVLIGVDNSNCNEGSKRKLSIGVIASIVLGVFLFVVIVCIIGGYILMKHCRIAKPLFRRTRARPAYIIPKLSVNSV